MTEDETVEAVAKRLEGKRHYMVYASEVVYYRIPVWAASESEARDQVYEGEVDIGDPQDAANFEVHDIQEVMP